MPTRGFTIVLALLAGCAKLPPPQPWTNVGPSRVLEVLNRHHCAGCHSVESVFGDASVAATEAPAEPERACTRARPANEGEGFCHVPTLASMERFRARWLRSFLESPIDLRPNLAELMIRHDLTPAEVDILIVGWRAQPEEPLTPAPSEVEVAQGAALFHEKQCGACHRFADLPLEAGSVATVRQRALAPDLQHARLRFSRSMVERFIFSPGAVKPTTEMPRTPLTPGEARALADFIYFAPLAVFPGSGRGTG